MDAHLAKILICIGLASVPAILWAWIFLKKKREPMSLVILTFIAGMVSVAPILLYKMSWEYFPSLDLFTFFEQFEYNVLSFAPLMVLPLGVIFTFVFVGVLEEYVKHLAVKLVDGGKFQDIDDAIEFSIMAALGFAFVENIMYFFYIWQYQGIDTLYVSFIFRSIFSTFAHILFSGVYGYYYGIAYFAEPIYQEEVRQNRHPIISFFHRVFHLKSSTVFAEEKVMEGLFIALALHAVFNIMLEISLTFMIVPFLVMGYGYLSYLLSQKRNHVKYGRVKRKADWED